MKRKLITVNETLENDFVDRCNALLNDGYKLHSSSCGVLNSESHNFPEIWMAIFILDTTPLWNKEI